MSPSSSGLGHRVLIPATWVRLPLGMPFLSFSRTPVIEDPECAIRLVLDLFHIGNQELALYVEIVRIVGQQPGKIGDRIDQARHFVKNHCFRIFEAAIQFKLADGRFDFPHGNFYLLRSNSFRDLVDIIAFCVSAHFCRFWQKSRFSGLHLA